MSDQLAMALVNSGNGDLVQQRENLSEFLEKTTKLQTPKKARKTRPGKGGGNWVYAKSDYFEDLLNTDYPGWTYMTKEWQITGPSGHEFVIASVRLIVSKYGIPRIIDDVGSAEVKYLSERGPDGKKHPTNQPLNVGSDVKAAITDGLKRCCYRLGYARDLRVDPADLDVTEEQFGLVMDSIENVSQHFKNMVESFLRNQGNQKNFESFVKTKIMPALKKHDNEGYEKLAEVFGPII